MSVACTTRNWYVRAGTPFFAPSDALNGADDGLGVGIVVGIELGECVGTLVGVCVGTAVGLLVGRRVGGYVGVRVGTADGEEVGCLVGQSVGKCVGALVGPECGSFFFLILFCTFRCVPTVNAQGICSRFTKTYLSTPNANFVRDLSNTPIQDCPHPAAEAFWRVAPLWNRAS